MTKSNSALRYWTRETALTAGAVVGVLCVLIAVGALVFGVKPLVFKSGSMGPDIDTGALGVAVSTPARDLRVGDIVSVTNDAGDRITHRIVGMKPGNGGRADLTLRGDANTAPDAQTYQLSRADRLLFSVNGVGYVVAALQSPAAIFAGGVLVGVLLMVAFKRRGAGDPSGERRIDRPSEEAAGRRSGRPTVRGAGAAAFAGLFGLVVPLGLSGMTTGASFTDVAAASAHVSAKTIGQATGSCTYNSSLLGGSFVITWKFPAGEPYSVPANVEFERSKTSGLGGVLEPLDSGSISTTGPDETGRYTTIVDTSLLGGLLGGDFRFGITVKDSGWRSETATANAHVGLAGLSGRCTTPFD